jgi:hypothetical protein
MTYEILLPKRLSLNLFKPLALNFKFTENKRDKGKNISIMRRNHQ